MRHLKPLILSGKIKTFEDMVAYSSVKEIARAMGCGAKQVEAIRKDCSVMTLGQLFGLVEALGMEKNKWKVANIFCE